MKKLLLIALTFFFLASCGNRNNSGGLANINASEDKSGKVNVITQSMPSIMIIPSDQCLQREGFMKTVTMNGRTVYDRDYNGFLLHSETTKSMIRSLQEFFVKEKYPLTDLEQTLKSITNQESMDLVDGVAKDAKTLLVSTCKPDIILEVDYSETSDLVTRVSVKKRTSFSMVALDAFTNKAVSSFNKAEIDGSITDYIGKDLKASAKDFLNQIQGYFKDIIVNGREITFRVQIDQNSSINLTDEINNIGDTYSDWIREWVKTNAKNGAANMQKNTAKEIYFTNVRITNLSDDGTQFNAYDFATAFRRAFGQTFQTKCLNNTQGLGDASLIIK